jgi:hypothetical protein
MKRAPPPAHVAALLAKGAELSLPRPTFRRDLTHWDRLALMERDSRLPFGWALHRDGTHLILPELPAQRARLNRQGAGCPAKLLPAMVAGAFADPERPIRWFWWNGFQLIEVIAPSDLARRLEAYEEPQEEEAAL